MGVTPEKQATVAALKEELASSKGIVLVTYKGLTVAQDLELRRAIRAAGVTYKVIKNTLTRIAAKEQGIDELIPHLEGTTAMASSADDAVAPAKAINDFIKKNKLDDAGVLVIKAGMVDGKVISVDEVKALANLPSREVLIAKLLGSMQAPIANSVGVMQGIIRKVVYALNAVREKKESA